MFTAHVGLGWTDLVFLFRGEQDYTYQDHQLSISAGLESYCMISGAIQYTRHRLLTRFSSVKDSKGVLVEVYIILIQITDIKCQPVE